MRNLPGAQWALEDLGSPVDLHPLSAQTSLAVLLDQTPHHLPSRLEDTILNTLHRETLVFFTNC